MQEGPSTWSQERRPCTQCKLTAEASDDGSIIQLTEESRFEMSRSNLGVPHLLGRPTAVSGWPSYSLTQRDRRHWMSMFLQISYLVGATDKR